MAQNEIPSTGIDITKRFYHAVDILISRGDIRGLGTLAKMWNTSRFVLSTTRSFPEKKRINVEFLYYIHRDFNVSTTWLLSGMGEIFTK